MIKKQLGAMLVSYVQYLDKPEAVVEEKPAF
jgi:hypothetical protein